MNRLHRPPASARFVREVSAAEPPTLVHAEWAEAFPWLVQGTTTLGAEDAPFDLGLFSSGISRVRAERHWDRLRASTGMRRIVHARQVHGNEVRVHGFGPPGLELVDACDAHVTDCPGVLLGVTTADCVPVFVVDPTSRAVSVIHAGWRGAAAGVLAVTVATLAEEFGTEVEDLHVHLGPAICGACYEVGPEVFAALDQAVPAGPEVIDLRAVLADRALRLGVPAPQTTVSAHCTRCTGSGLFSHRAGDRERQVGFLGIRLDSAAGKS